jgi:hypothetical protein
MWREERLWNVRELQRVHLPALGNSKDLRAGSRGIF